MDYCNKCSVEYASPEDSFCSNCGEPRKPALPHLPTVQLNIRNKEETQTTTEIEETVSTETAVAEPEIQAQVTAQPTGIILPATSEPETSWQCPQCSHQNPLDAEYCDECGAMYVSPEERAKKEQEKANQALPAEVLRMLTFKMEDGQHPGWRLLSGSSTNEGVLRVGNADEDSVFVMELRRSYQAKPKFMGLYVVADGMGGQAAGEVASRNAIENIARLVMNELSIPWMAGQQFEQKQLEDIMGRAGLAAHLAVRDWNIANNKDSGSTLTMACVVNNQAVFANAGE